jgi:hypothetical protein
MNIFQTAAAGVLAIHGFIHLIGFVVPWRLATIEGFSYRTTALNGTFEIGDLGTRLVGLVWLGLVVGFLAAGAGVWRGEPWAVPFAASLAVLSLVVCVLGLPQAGAGVAINVAILGAIAYITILRPA